MVVLYNRHDEGCKSNQFNEEEFMKRIFFVFIFTTALVSQNYAQDSTATLSFGETYIVSQFFASARVATINAGKAQFDTVAAVAALGEKLTKVLSDSSRKAVLSVNGFDRYFIARMLNQRGLQIPAPWASTLLKIREKLDRAAGKSKK